MCDTAVSDGDAVTFCTATAPWRLSRARPPSRGSTPSSMNFWMKSGLAPSSEITTTRGDLPAMTGRLSRPRSGRRRRSARAGAATPASDAASDIAEIEGEKGFQVHMNAPCFAAQSARV